MAKSDRDGTWNVGHRTLDEHPRAPARP
jgi:hypothetical protein